MSQSAHVVRHEGDSAFDRALRTGIERGILDADVLDKLRKDVPKGIVQIAGVISTPYLQAELERAFAVLRGLVDKGLALLASGDPARAATLIRDRGVLALSREGNGRLKALRQLRHSPHTWELPESSWLSEAEFLERYALMPEAEFCVEEARRREFTWQEEAAAWLVSAAGGRMERDGSHDFAMWGRTALLVLASAAPWPDGVEAMRQLYARFIAAAVTKARRSKSASVPDGLNTVPVPDDCPPHLLAIVRGWQADCDSRVIPLIRATKAEALLSANADVNPVLTWLAVPEVSLADADLHGAHAESEWHKITGGKGSHASMVTVLANVAIACPPKASITRKNLDLLLHRLRADEIDSDAVRAFIQNVAPPSLIDDLDHLWSSFLADAGSYYDATELGTFLESELILPAKASRSKAKR